MAQKIQNITLYPEKRMNFLYPIIFFWGIVVLSILGFIWYEATFYDTRSRYFLPYCFLTGIAVAVPNLYLIYKGKFNLFNPLVFAAWIYFFPAFFVGGLVLASGLSEPYYLAFVRDERNDLPLTLIYVILGYLGLAAGYFLPFGKNLGKKLGDYLPDWNWKPEQVILPGLLLLALGYFNTILAFIYGILGYQRVEETGVYDGLLFLTTLWGIEASFLLWMVIFRTKKLNLTHYIIAGILLVSALTKSAFQGNRGSLIFFLILISCAFILSERKIFLRHKIYGAALLILALIVGMIYGTTFRSVRQSEEHVSMEVYAESIVETMGKVSEQDISATLGNGFSALAERIESVSPLAVVVSNYEILRPYEESYCLDNNIWKDSVTFFIPRIIWNDKPVASEARKYGDLYFNFGENSFVVTPMGDLLRNFGPVGVPIGMIILGFIIRLIYACLIENREFSFWRTTLFYMLITNLSYEGFYGSIVPYLIKVGFITVVGIIFLRFLIKNPESAAKTARA
jgi:hypothetical protein